MRAATLDDISYRLIMNNTHGKLTCNVTVATGIVGHRARIDEPELRTTLSEDGILWVGANTVWDFGSGPALNTPEMVRASLVHDMFCHMTDRGLVPWECRRQCDILFYRLLKRYGPKRPWYNPKRYWHFMRYLAVRSYSMTFARLRAKPFEGY